MNKTYCKPMRIICCKKGEGFTLIELLLYIGLAAILLLTISAFYSLILQSRLKNQTMAEVEQQGEQVMQIITQSMRNADSITSPIPGNSSSSLILAVPSPAKNPTTFELASGVIRLTEGASSPLNLTSSRITVSSLSFQNLSRPTTTGNIRVTFTLTYNNLSGRNEYEYTKTFYGSASLR